MPKLHRFQRVAHTLSTTAATPPPPKPRAMTWMAISLCLIAGYTPHLRPAVTAPRSVAPALLLSNGGVGSGLKPDDLLNVPFGEMLRDPSANKERMREARRDVYAYSDWAWHREAFHVAGAVPTVFTSGVAKAIWIELEFVIFMCGALLLWNDGMPHLAHLLSGEGGVLGAWGAQFGGGGQTDHKSHTSLTRVSHKSHSSLTQVSHESHTSLTPSFPRGTRHLCPAHARVTRSPLFMKLFSTHHTFITRAIFCMPNNFDEEALWRTRPQNSHRSSR